MATKVTFSRRLRCSAATRGITKGRTFHQPGSCSAAARREESIGPPLFILFTRMRAALVNVEPAPLLATERRHYHTRGRARAPGRLRSEEHTSELQSLMRIAYAVF